MFDLRIPASMAALPGRIHAMQNDEGETLAYIPLNPPAGISYTERLMQMRRNTRDVAAIQKRIAAATDPIVRRILECYAAGQSVEAIARAAGMGVERVRAICRGMSAKNETRSCNSGPLTVATDRSRNG